MYFKVRRIVSSLAQVTARSWNQLTGLAVLGISTLEISELDSSYSFKFLELSGLAHKKNNPFPNTEFIINVKPACSPLRNLSQGQLLQVSFCE